MKRMIKIISIILLMIFLIMLVQQTCVLALVDGGGGGSGGSGGGSGGGGSGADIFAQAKEWFTKAKQGGQNYVTPSNVVASLKPIAQIMVWAGVIVLIVAYPVMGIKYMISEPDKKADLKTKLIGLVVASIVIFGAYGIWKVTYIFMNELVR